MYIIIIGASKIGRHLTQILVEEGHDVVVVDKDGNRCHEVASEYEALTIRGNATRPNVLEDAGISEADSVLVLTGTDETNLVVGLIAKQMGAKEVGIRLGATHYDESVLHKLGIDRAIYPEANAAGYISQVITKPELVDLSFLGKGEAVILELEVVETSKISGKKVKEIEKPDVSSIVAIYENGDLVIPTPDTEVKTGQKVLMLTRKEKTKQIEKLA
ncbi:MAG: potassium channel family protein [archaeon]